MRFGRVRGAALGIESAAEVFDLLPEGAAVDVLDDKGDQVPPAELFGERRADRW